MQKYSLFKYAPNLNHSFFELFLRIEAKVLSYKDVVEHIFLGYRRKGGKGYTLLYSHARWKGEDTGVCTRERKRKYRKGEEDAQRKPERESKEKKKRTEEKGIERLKRKKAGRRGNRSKGGKYEKKGRDRSLLKFYTLGKRKKLCHPQQFD